MPAFFVGVQMLFFGFVQNDQGGNHAGNPCHKSEQKNNEYRTASLVKNSQRREDDSEKNS